MVEPTPDHARCQIGVGRESTKTRVGSTSRAPPPRYVGRYRDFVFVRASSRILLARAGLNTPHEQNRDMTAAACSGVRRFSFTKSIIFLASEWLTMPCPHMVDSIATCRLGMFSVLPSKPSE